MSILIHEFCSKLKNLKGDVIEFGTGGGRCTEILGKRLPDKKIITFDGFVGLPKTSKRIPEGSDWFEGSFCYDEDATRKQLSKYKNIEVHKEMTWDLKEPSFYQISQICGVNFDLDLYEGTVDGLNFCNQCEWNNLLLRFDDWAAYPHQKEEIHNAVKEHEQAAFFEFISANAYKYKIDINRPQALIWVYRD